MLENRLSTADLVRRVVNKRRQRRIESLGGERAFRRVPAGFEMMIDPAQSNDRSYFLGVFERALTSVIRRLVRSGDLCLDLGANKGYFTLTLAKAVGPKGAVVSVEPDPPIYEELKANCERNRFTWVTTYDCALGGAPGSCEFALNSVVGNSSRFPNQLAQETLSSWIEVEIRTVDSIIEDANTAVEGRPLSFAKLDVEGSEPLVLVGMASQLRRHRPVLYLEVNESSLVAGGMSAQLIEDVLRPLGYQFWSIEWSRPRLFATVKFETVAPLATEMRNSYRDVLAVTPDSPMYPRLRASLSEFGIQV